MSDFLPFTDVDDPEIQHIIRVVFATNNNLMRFELLMESNFFDLLLDVLENWPVNVPLPPSGNLSQAILHAKKLNTISKLLSLARLPMTRARSQEVFKTTKTKTRIHFGYFPIYRLLETKIGKTNKINSNFWFMLQSSPDKRPRGLYLGSWKTEYLFSLLLTFNYYSVAGVESFFERTQNDQKKFFFEQNYRWTSTDV